MPESQKTVLIADDHPIFRKGLVETIEKDSGFSVISEVGDGEEALQLIRDKKPDVAIIDISMPGMDGIQIARAVQSEGLSTECVILTMYDDENYFNEAVDCGVKGYLLKDTVGRDLIGCLRSVVNERHYVSPALSGFLLDRKAKGEALRKKVPTIESLTPSEKRVLRLLGENMTSKEIAQKLHVSVRTVQNHRSRICDKLGIHGHNKLLQFALENKSYL